MQSYCKGDRAFTLAKFKGLAMYEQKKTVETRLGRAVWQRPELRQLKAGAAENANGGTTDSAVLS